MKDTDEERREIYLSHRAYLQDKLRLMRWDDYVWQLPVERQNERAEIEAWCLETLGPQDG